MEFFIKRSKNGKWWVLWARDRLGNVAVYNYMRQYKQVKKDLQKALTDPWTNPWHPDIAYSDAYLREWGLKGSYTLFEELL